jgi:hypothetical protein
LSEGAIQLQLLYVGFVIAELYGFTIALETNHLRLFVDAPVPIFFLSGVQIATSAFFAFFPLIFLLLHFQLLWQMARLRKKAEMLYLANKLESPGRSVSQALTLRASKVVFAAILLERGSINRIAKEVLFSTTVLLPIALLVFLQIKFLPFHSEGITWIHRGILLCDVSLLALFWIIWSPLPSSKGADKSRGFSEKTSIFNFTNISVVSG